ncbi:hypothetical protein NQ317_011268 [Molorchus minor]|uniref:Uncharacterized protein n=1 Tax=Molorchus minor TaxID=1323400 RepID=A0ABQ9JUD0_9CUCU|nr:hypothetical protein NQ317_011268 [Molorchus minor]
MHLDSNFHYVDDPTFAFVSELSQDIPKPNSQSTQSVKSVPFLNPDLIDSEKSPRYRTRGLGYQFKPLEKSSILTPR